MRILTSLVVVAALSGCAYQSGYIDPQGVWIAKGEPYARGTCRSTAPSARRARWGSRGVPGCPDHRGHRESQAQWGPSGRTGQLELLE